MCGIAGRLNFLSGAHVAAPLVAQMCDLIAHRGPDGEGTLVQGAIGLGHRRLAIIDLSPAGRQPMMGADGRYWITFNGEIYNFLELDASWRRTASISLANRHGGDPRRLRKYGIACLSKLRGMFAFAIWDAESRTLFLARDRLGKKPLHYLLDRDGFSFASEPKAFLADPSFAARAQPRGDLRLSHLSVRAEPVSAFQGVRSCPPAHCLLVRDGGLTSTGIGACATQPSVGAGSRRSPRNCSRVLREAVRLRLISDVPLGRSSAAASTPAPSSR